jgi:hypothetical protein
VFVLELGEDEAKERCRHCGGTSSTGHGFIYKDSVPHAVYFASWSSDHYEHGVLLAIAIGQWGEESTNRERVCFGLEAHEGEKDVLLRFMSPQDSPWPDTDLLGPMLSREAALAHHLKSDVLAIAETIVSSHPGVRRFLRA